MDFDGDRPHGVFEGDGGVHFVRLGCGGVGPLVLEGLEAGPLPGGGQGLAVDLQPEGLGRGMGFGIEATGVEVDEAGPVPAAADEASLAQGFFVRGQAGAVGDERLRAGWTPGSLNRDAKRSPFLVPWSELDEKVKEYDRVFVRGLPRFLASAGFQIVRVEDDASTRAEGPEGSHGGM